MTEVNPTAVEGLLLVVAQRPDHDGAPTYNENLRANLA
jgi:hypothetical protein